MYLAIILSVINGVMMCFASYKFFQMIQLSGYRLKGYFLWLKETKFSYASRMIVLSLLSAFCTLVTSTLFSKFSAGGYYSYIGLVFYFYFTIVFIASMNSLPKKVPLKITTRMTRINVMMLILTSGITFILVALCSEYLPFVGFNVVCFVPILLPFLVPIVHIILLPLEKIIATCYVVRAKRKLKKMGDLVKIGITGSYGKTSTKYILNTILSEKYKVCMSPHSFNTLMGLTKVVNNYLAPDDEILIAEMGAKRKGDIKELCDLIGPTYGIITGVGNQHLATFRNKETILNTKFELVESLPEGKGACVYNGFDEGAKKLYDRPQKTEKILSGVDDNISATNVKYDQFGTTFTLNLNEKTYDIKTELLGLHNVRNILLCVSVAKRLNLTDTQIVSGISKLHPVPHRLELINNGTNIILDDSFNSSVEGSAMALDVLKNMTGKKIVITPGLVELGNDEDKENRNFGKKIASVADYVIIVNNVNFASIKAGLNAEKFGEDRVYQAENLQKAKLLLKDFVSAGDTILFANDLPDNYT